MRQFHCDFCDCEIYARGPYDAMSSEGWHVDEGYIECEGCIDDRTVGTRHDCWQMDPPKGDEDG